MTEPLPVGTGAGDGADVGETDADGADATAAGAETTVTVRCPGHVRTEPAAHEFEYPFGGDTPRAVLNEPPGTWPTNSVGEQPTTCARIPVNGQFNESENGFDTEPEAGDRVASVSPLCYC